MIIIDSDNYAEHGIETLFFPGGEPHVKIPDAINGDVLLFAKLRTWNDVGIAACLLSALFLNPYVRRAHSFIPYFPAARQDRSDGHAPLTLELTSALLANDFPEVHVFDPHSSILFDWLAQAQPWMPKHLEVPHRRNVVGIIAPDEGATKRAIDFQTAFYPRTEFIQCTKRRDPTTGRLSGYHMPQLSDAGRYIIVDDICDGGGTFNLLAGEFAKDPASDYSHLELFVSHGIFSKGLDAIDPRIERITTTDSWCKLASNERLEVLPLAPLFPLITGGQHA